MEPSSALEIKPLPHIPRTLRQAALQSQLIPFVGAGVSQLGGCPGWDQFANDTLNFFVGHKKLTHAQLSQVKALPSRAKLSFALEMERRCGLSIDFRTLLKPADEKKEKEGKAVYSNLSRLATTFVTTNYDECLDTMPPSSFPAIPQLSSSAMMAAPRRPFYQQQEIRAENLDIPNAVFHLHGSINDRKSMVLTTVDYLKRYASHRPNGDAERENSFLTFLELLFSLKNVLFLGYGLNELEILEYVIQKANHAQTRTDEEPRHYIVQGFFSHEIELARSLEIYFRQFGVGLLPFSRDHRDWAQLADVIEYLAGEIPPGPNLTLPRLNEMEELLS